MTMTGCSSGGASSGDGGDVTIEFSQWWAPELPEGALQELIDGFEDENPGVTVEMLSGPYASVQDQTFTAAASNTMADVVGLDGAWVNDLQKQGALANMTDLMADADYDDSQLASQVQVDGGTYMIPVVNFIYPMFTNDDLLAEAGVSSIPQTRSEFAAAAAAISDIDSTTKGWVIPLSTENPNGIQNDLMSWVWASGGSMLDDDGQPDLTNAAVTSATTFVKDLYEADDVTPGALTLQEPDKVTEFINGRVGMMIDSLSRIDTIKEASPDLNFSISAIPAEDGYEGERGIPYASWGLGVSAQSENPEESWALVSYLMSESVNSELSTLANAFPGNTASTPDFSDADPLYEDAFEIYQSGYPANEFVGLPTADSLMRTFDEQFQRVLTGDQSVEEALETSQTEWLSEF
ncbi:ABC transporter substrate-binding protein [Marisediminicola sp. LYQ134]|uniref:ABC transporter substrate-binding protein n=1 Tax=Marisediminicola sp. LYQ134 TaxID=3391061 RepID=UPI0039837A9B